jgi:hypothetical protein
MLTGMPSAQVELPTADEDDPDAGSHSASVTRLHSAEPAPIPEGKPRSHVRHRRSPAHQSESPKTGDGHRGFATAQFIRLG